MTTYSDYLAPGLNTYNNSAVDHLINGTTFFSKVDDEMNALLARTGSSGRFFYMASWYLALVKGPGVVQSDFSQRNGSAHGGVNVDLAGVPPFKIDPNKTFLDKLVAMHKAGIEVRLMPWVSPYITNYQEGAANAGYLWGQMLHSLMSANKLRKDCADTNVVMVNTLNHVVGSIHTKLIVCGDEEEHNGELPYAVGFTSGLDPVDNRLQGWWHDCGVRVTGPAVAGMYKFFYDMWGECRQQTGVSLKIKDPNYPQSDEVFARSDAILPGRHLVNNTTIFAATGTRAVQVLPTLPQMNYALTPSGATAQTGMKTMTPAYRLLLKAAGFPNPLSIAPSGRFDYSKAISHAISQAQEYIYMEDQAFQSLELMQALNDRMRAAPSTLKIIFMFGYDPADGPVTMVLPEGIDRLLGSGQTALGADQIARIAFYCAYNTPNVAGNRIIHSKLTIIDDKWCAVGSANFMRRSLAMDGELSIGVADADATPFAKKLRCALWAKHTDPGIAGDFVNLQKSLRIWDGAWGSPGVAGEADNVPDGVTLKPQVKRKALPFVFSHNDTPAADQWPGNRQAFAVKTYDERNGDSKLIY